MTERRVRDVLELPGIDTRIALVEERIGYTFTDRSLIARALIHPSAVETDALHDSYERLEFLGDSCLSVIIAEELYHRFPNIDEGGLTRLKVSLVSGETLSRVAEEYGFADAILFGSSERGTGKRGLHSALENVFESVLAALYLDGGIEVAREWALRVLAPYINEDAAREPESPKSSLQELLQKHHVTPTYRLVSQDGPPHDRTFTAQVLSGDKVIGEGTGRSKKEAEACAARAALLALETEH